MHNKDKFLALAQYIHQKIFYKTVLNIHETSRVVKFVNFIQADL